MSSIRTCSLLVSMFLAILASIAAAQTVAVSVSGGSGQLLGGSVGLVGMREGDLTADLRFGVTHVDAGSAHGLLSARIARSTAAGLVGAATVELEGALRTDGQRLARLSGQGVLGPASVRLTVAAATAPPGAFTSSGIAPSTTAPRFEDGSVALGALVRYRIDRNLLGSVEPSLFVTQHGIAFRTDASLRVRDAVPPFDAILEVHGYLAPGHRGWSGAVGFGGIWAPRRAPEWRTTVWVGWAEGGLRPGIAVQGAASIGRGLTVAVDLAAESFRVDVPPYRATVALDMELGRHEAFVVGQAQAGSGAAVAVTVGTRLSLDRR